MGLTGTYILIAVLVSNVGGSPRPVSLAIEFNSKETCEIAKRSIRDQAKAADFITCEKK